MTETIIKKKKALCETCAKSSETGPFYHVGRSRTVFVEKKADKDQDVCSDCSSMLFWTNRYISPKQFVEEESRHLLTSIRSLARKDVPMLEFRIRELLKLRPDLSLFSIPLPEPEVSKKLSDMFLILAKDQSGMCLVGGQMKLVHIDKLLDSVPTRFAVRNAKRHLRKCRASRSVSDILKVHKRLSLDIHKSDFLKKELAIWEKVRHFYDRHKDL